MKIEFFMIDCYCFFGCCFQILATSCKLLFTVKKRTFEVLLCKSYKLYLVDYCMNNNTSDRYFISFSCYHFHKEHAKNSILLLAKRRLHKNTCSSLYARSFQLSKNWQRVIKMHIVWQSLLSSQNSTFPTFRVEW